jgi:hypothetical protein
VTAGEPRTLAAEARARIIGGMLARLLLCCPFALAPMAQEPAQGPTDAKDKTPSDFVRFVRVEDGGHLDTAITTYTKGDVTLLLFGAVHIADRVCYAALNDRFTTCDVLLYELVAAPDDKPGKGREERSFNLLSALQHGLKNSLELTFQLDEIDYQAANFVHADMTPEEFQASMAERGESLLSIMFSMMSQGMKLQQEQAESGTPEPAPFDLAAAFRKREGHHLMRLTFAQQMEQIERMALGGDGGTTLLEGRNEKCLEVLQQQLAAGKKRIGIYYGAAHFPHMEKRLVADLGFAKVDHEWLIAWDCKKRMDQAPDRAMLRLRRRCRDELQELGRAAKAYRDGRAVPVPTLVQLSAAVDGGASAYAGPTKDPWGNDYLVRKRAVGTRLEAVSKGPDGQLDTDDDLVEVEARRGGLFGR